MKIIPKVNPQFILACLFLLCIALVALSLYSSQDRQYTQDTFREVVMNPGESLQTYVFARAAPVPQPLAGSRAKTVYLFALSPDFIISLTALVLLVTIPGLAIWALVTARKGNVPADGKPVNSKGAESAHH